MGTDFVWLQVVFFFKGLPNRVWVCIYGESWRWKGGSCGRLSVHVGCRWQGTCWSGVETEVGDEDVYVGQGVLAGMCGLWCG